MKSISTDAAPDGRAGTTPRRWCTAASSMSPDSSPSSRAIRERRLADFEEQARQVIDNVVAILEAAGSARGPHPARDGVHRRRRRTGPRSTRSTREMLGDHRPARTVVPVAQLHYGYLVEMDVIAALRGS